MYTLKIENAYEDGYEQTTEALVDAPGPDDDLTDTDDTWWQEVAFAATGTDTGRENLSAYYRVEIIACDREEHLGLVCEWD